MHIVENLPNQDIEPPMNGEDNEDSKKLTDTEKIQKEKDRLDEIEDDLKKNGGRR